MTTSKPIFAFFASIALVFASLAPSMATTCYVCADGGSTPAEPYGTWATAAATIGDAYAFLQANQGADGDEIVLGEGTHALSDELYFNWPCVIRGETGDPADVVVAGNDTFRLFTLNHAGAAVASITLTGGRTKTNGYYAYGAAVRIAAPQRNATPTSNFDYYNKSQAGAGGTVSNCIVTANSTSYKWCAAILYANATIPSNAVITHCQIVDNWTSRQDDIGSTCSGSAAWIESGQLLHSLVAKNYQKVLSTTAADTWGGTVVVGAGLVQNCTVADNSMNGKNTCGGIVASGSARVINCLVTGNNTTSTTHQYATWRGTAECFVNCLLDNALPNNTCRNANRVEFQEGYDEYRLAPGSDGIDCALTEVEGVALGWPATDVVRGARILDGDDDGVAVPDIGSAEFNPYLLNVKLSAGATDALLSSPIQLSAQVRGYAEGDTLRFYWDIDSNGTTDAETGIPSYTVTFATGGFHGVTVVCSNLTSAASARASVTRLRIETPVYAAEDGTDDAAGTRANPMSLYAALERVKAEDYVTAILLPGTYGVEAETVIKTPSSVRGESGDPADTIIRRTGTSAYRLFTLDNADALIAGVTFENGYTSGNYWYGGAVRIAPETVGSGANGSTSLRGAGGIVSNCIIRSCSARGKWSGGSAVMLQSEAALVTHCVISNNAITRQADASGYAGGIVYIRFAGVVRDCLIVGNNDSTDNAASTVGLSNGGSIVNCTVVGNSVSGANGIGGVYVAQSGEVVNCVIAQNSSTGASATANVWGGVSGAFINCAADEGDPINETCLSIPGDIGFADAVHGDYRLSAASPCRDAGADHVSQAAGDLDGRPRVSGAAIDIGCFEFDANVFSVGVTPSVTVAFAPAEITLSATVGGTNGTDSIRFLWDVDGDGDTDAVTDGPSWTGTFSESGFHDVAVTATNTTAGTAATMQALQAFRLGPRILYASTDNALAAEPYDTPETAAASIQDAIDSALEGAEVVVLRGVHPITAQVVVDKAITLHGETANPADTVITRASGKIRCLEVNGTGAFVHTLTLDNGHGSSLNGGGLCIHSKGGVVSNCVIRNCFLEGKWGAGTAFYVSGVNSLLTHCVVTNNAAKMGYTDGGDVTGVAGNVMDGATIEHSLIARNKSHATHHGRGDCTLVLGKNAKARFCTIADNVATNVAGINLFDDTAGFDHCVIAGNVSASTNARLRVWGAMKTITTGASATAMPAQFEAEEANAQAASGRSLVSDSVNAVDCGTLLGTGTIVAGAETLFRSPARADYRHSLGSPAMNVVLPADAGAMPSVDLTGGPRLLRAKYDLGCYECEHRGTFIFIQ